MPSTLAAWPERRILDAMRGWRRGCGPLLPWFRATPFAAAHHYRERTLVIEAAARSPRVATQLAAMLPRATPDTLWVFDLPGTVALWLGHELRGERGLASALCWNGWYDPHGVLDGSEEIPLLLTLGRRLMRGRAPRGCCLVFDAGRHGALRTGGPPGALERIDALDNRYALNEDDAPAIEQLRAMGIGRVQVYTWSEPAADLAGYVEYLEREMAVSITDRLMLKVDAHGG